MRLEKYLDHSGDLLDWVLNVKMKPITERIVCITYFFLVLFVLFCRLCGNSILHPYLTRINMQKKNNMSTKVPFPSQHTNFRLLHGHLEDTKNMTSQLILLKTKLRCLLSFSSYWQVLLHCNFACYKFAPLSTFSPHQLRQVRTQTWCSLAISVEQMPLLSPCCTTAT